MDISGGKLKSVIQHCTYEISTGKWKPGEKLPSVRKAEKLWGVNRLTVLSAYRQLAEMGLVISEDRRGYFVASGKATTEDESVRKELELLYQKAIDLIRKNTSYEPSAVLTYFASLIEKEQDQQPELAFLECSTYQAEGHAEEIRNKLNVSVLPLHLDSDFSKSDIPSHVKTLLTTGFHIREVKKIGDKHNLEVINIPIEVNRDLFDRINIAYTSAVIFELEESMSQDIFDDVKKLSNNTPLSEQVVNDVNKEIEDYLASNTDSIILLSPRVWGKTQRRWQQNARVYPIQFVIKKEAWPLVSHAVKLPFKTVF